jgi:hypothetical protein
MISANKAVNRYQIDILSSLNVSFGTSHTCNISSVVSGLNGFLAVKALGYKPKRRGFETDEVKF